MKHLHVSKNFAKTVTDKEIRILLLHKFAFLGNYGVNEIVKYKRTIQFSVELLFFVSRALIHFFNYD